MAALLGLLAVSVGPCRAQAPAPWPVRSGQAIRGEWEAYASPSGATRDGVLAVHGGEGDASLRGLPIASLDVAPAPSGASAWWALDRARRVLHLRLNLADAPIEARVIASGLPDPVAVPIGTGPFVDGSWSWMIDLDADGYRDAVVSIDGSSGGATRDVLAENLPGAPNPTTHPLHAGDELRVYAGTGFHQRITLPTVTGGRIGSLGDLAWYVEGLLGAVAGAGPNPPDGATWDLGWDPLESTCRHASLSIL